MYNQKNRRNRNISKDKMQVPASWLLRPQKLLKQ